MLEFRASSNGSSVYPSAPAPCCYRLTVWVCCRADRDPRSLHWPARGPPGRWPAASHGPLVVQKTPETLDIKESHENGDFYCLPIFGYW